MNDVIKKMQDSNKSWYKDFFANCEWVKKHASQISVVGESGDSFCFGNAQIKSKEESWKSLNEVFKFLRVDGFREKFEQAVNGDGHESKRITRLHSSSLLPFLLFSQVSSKKPIKVKVNRGQEETFSEARFEVRNWLKLRDRHPSNVDVVLENDNTILFLESKFTEYLTCGRKVEFSKSRYGERLEKLRKALDKVNVELANGYVRSSESRYLTGIKQLVAHYMGLEYALDLEKGGNKYNQGGKETLSIGNRKVYLGEVIFEFGGSDAFTDYQQLYSAVVPALLKTCQLKKENMPLILSKPLTYQDLFADYELDNDVGRFYQLSKKFLTTRSNFDHHRP